MKLKYYLIIFCFSCIIPLWSQPFLQIPVTGTTGVDWTIVNYVDWEVNDHTDAYCGTKCYDGHEGTDFTLRSFPQMDTGVYVLAAADGVVTFVIDSLFDREKTSVISKGLGNYIAIAHPNKYYSYYGHLKKNSAVVNVGDRVLAGDTIGQIGSSGNSTDPHLHFELYYDSLFVVDPFQGPCGNPSSLWLRTPFYETELNVWDQGMHNQSIGIDDLRERITTVECCPYRFPKTSSSPLIYWAHMYGLRKGKTLTIEWYNPDQILWFTYDFTFDRDWWYYYFWSDIFNTDLPEGEWYVRLMYDGKEVTRQDFLVDGTTSTKDKSPKDCNRNWNLLDDLTRAVESNKVQAFNVSGRMVSADRLRRMRGEMVFIRDINSECVQKVLLFQ